MRRGAVAYTVSSPAFDSRSMAFSPPRPRVHIGDRQVMRFDYSIFGGLSQEITAGGAADAQKLPDPAREHTEQVREHHPYFAVTSLSPC